MISLYVKLTQNYNYEQKEEKRDDFNAKFVPISKYFNSQYARALNISTFIH